MSKYRVTVTAEAQDDRKNIHRYITEHAFVPMAARRQFANLLDFPSPRNVIS
jgi:hypothetical protein